MFKAFEFCLPTNATKVPAGPEMRILIGFLNLPIGERGRRRAAARKEWYASAQAPLEIDKVLID
jgi:chromosome partitioning protein